MDKPVDIISALLHSFQLSFSKDIAWTIAASKKSCVVKINLSKGHYAIFTCTIVETSKSITDIVYSASIFNTEVPGEKEVLVKEIRNVYFYTKSDYWHFLVRIQEFIKDIAEQCS